MSKAKSLCFKTESFGAVDGPGIRLVIFLQGCPMRCLYCHNPESWNFESKEASNITVKEILDLYEKNKSYYQNDNGGITISGGEPTLHFDFLVNLAKECHKKNIHLTIDTSCYFWKNNFKNKFDELINYVDLWLVDIKHMIPEKCEYITGVKNLDACGFIEYLEKNKKHYWVRNVLVPGISDDEQGLYELGKFIGKLKYMDKFELLPYHDMAKPKYQNLKMKYALEKIEPANSTDVARAMKIIKNGFEQTHH